MTPCRQWNEELLECALGRPLTPALSAHLARCAECSGALEALRAKAREMDRVLTGLAASEPRRGGPERVLARIATTAPVPAYPRLVAAAVALVILAGLVGLTTRPGRTIRLSTRLSAHLSTWRSPTECLLRSPADPLLKSVPRLGEGLFELHPAKENYAQ